MVQYRYALKDNGETVDAEAIAGKPIDSNYVCIGCNNLLIAKVNGQQVKPHFAHKRRVECNGETYLHRLGKSKFLETYRHCLESGEPYWIKLLFSRQCTKFPNLLQDCNLGTIEKEFDLTTYYQSIEEEKRDGCFIPDILLASNKKAGEKIYIEIAVTHFLSEDKKKSGTRIIEIPLESESDISRITKKILTEEDASFIGFNRCCAVVPDSECHCRLRPCVGFYVYKDGKARLELSTLTAVHSYIQNNTDKIIYNNVIILPKSTTHEHFQISDSYGNLFREQLFLAAERKIPVRNCFLCKYHGNNWSAITQSPIYCKPKKISCNSNAAAACAIYKTPDPQDLQRQKQY